MASLNKTMKRILYLITFLTISLNILAQQDTIFIKHSKDWTPETLIYETDTVIFSSEMMRHILTGTTILPQTHNQMNAKGYGLYFENVTKTECQSHGEEVYSSSDKINYIISTDSSLIVDINIYDNCCYDFLCDISIDSAGELNLIYYGYGSYCACDCCFGMCFHFEKLEVEEKIKTVIINGDKKTLKEIE